MISPTFHRPVGLLQQEKARLEAQTTEITKKIVEAKLSIEHWNDDLGKIARWIEQLDAGMAHLHAAPMKIPLRSRIWQLFGGKPTVEMLPNVEIVPRTVDPEPPPPMVRVELSQPEVDVLSPRALALRQKHWDETRAARGS